jgi:hypothetical protein
MRERREYVNYACCNKRLSALFPDAMPDYPWGISPLLKMVQQFFAQGFVEPGTQEVK